MVAARARTVRDCGGGGRRVIGAAKINNQYCLSIFFFPTSRHIGEAARVSHITPGACASTCFHGDCSYADSYSRLSLAARRTAVAIVVAKVVCSNRLAAAEPAAVGSSRTTVGRDRVQVTTVKRKRNWAHSIITNNSGICHDVRPQTYVACTDT